MSDHELGRPLPVTPAAPDAPDGLLERAGAEPTFAPLGAEAPTPPAWLVALFSRSTAGIARHLATLAGGSMFVHSLEHPEWFSAERIAGLLLGLGPILWHLLQAARGKAAAPAADAFAGPAVPLLARFEEGLVFWGMGACVALIAALLVVAFTLILARALGIL